MKNNKKALLGVAFVASIIALAGVGYAASQTYTGQTASTGGDFDVDWIVLKLNEDAYEGPVNKEVVWNSVTTGYANEKYVIRYEFVQADVVEHTLTVDKSAASEAGTTYKLKATVGNFTSDIYTLQYQVNGGAWTASTDTTEGNLTSPDGMTVDNPASITVNWRVFATTYNYPADHEADPGTSVTMPGITYVITATESS